MLSRVLHEGDVIERRGGEHASRGGSHAASSQQLEQARKDPVLESLDQALPHLDFRLLASNV